jgi:hypothetical protein
MIEKNTTTKPFHIKKEDLDNYLYIKNRIEKINLEYYIESQNQKIIKSLEECISTSVSIVETNILNFINTKVENKYFKKLNIKNKIDNKLMFTFFISLDLACLIEYFSLGGIGELKDENMIEFDEIEENLKFIFNKDFLVMADNLEIETSVSHIQLNNYNLTIKNEDVITDLTLLINNKKYNLLFIDYRIKKDGTLNNEFFFGLTALEVMERLEIEKKFINKKSVFGIENENTIEKLINDKNIASKMLVNMGRYFEVEKIGIEKDSKIDMDKIFLDNPLSCDKKYKKVVVYEKETNNIVYCFYFSFSLACLIENLMLGGVVSQEKIEKYKEDVDMSLEQFIMEIMKEVGINYLKSNISISNIQKENIENIQHIIFDINNNYYELYYFDVKKIEASNLNFDSIKPIEKEKNKENKYSIKLDSFILEKDKDILKKVIKTITKMNENDSIENISIDIVLK